MLTWNATLRFTLMTAMVKIINLHYHFPTEKSNINVYDTYIYLNMCGYVCVCSMYVCM